MKVLYVTQYFSPRPTHASTVTTYEIVKRLAQKGHNVGVISAASPGIVRTYGENVSSCQTIDVFPIPEFSTRWYDGFTTILTHTLTHAPLVIGALNMYQFHENFGAIISMFHPTHMATVSARLLSRILKVPLVVKVHDFIIETMEPNMLRRTYNMLMGIINLRALKGSNAILVQSPELRGVIKKQSGIDEEKMVIFPNGVDTNLFRPDIKSDKLRKRLGLEGKTVLLFLGGLHKGRHPELLIRALPDIVREVRHLKVLFVGEGPEKSNLLALAEHLGVSDFVKFAGIVGHSIVPDFISIADVAVGPLTLTCYPTMYGSTPRTVSEYMACEKPVVVPRGAVSESLVIDGYNGVLFEPGDVQGLSSAIVNLIEDRRFAKFLGRNARRHVEEVASWHVLIARLENLLNSLVNSAS